MADVTAPGISADQAQQMIATAIAAIPAAPTTFVNGGTAMTIDGLMTNFPPSVTYNGMYARVNNLFNGASLSAAGGIDDIVRCRRDITNGLYRWVPQREAFNTSQALTSGVMNLTPLVTPPTVRLTGTLLGNLTLTPSTVNAYVGQTFTVIQNSTLGLFITQVTGLLGSNVTLLGNTTQVFEYLNSGWAKSTP